MNLIADSDNDGSGSVFIGSGKQTKGISVESVLGTTVQGARVHLLGSDVVDNGYARIGNGAYVPIYGNYIHVTATAGNATAVGALAGKTDLGAVNLFAGGRAGSYAQIGDGGTGQTLTNLAGSISPTISVEALNGGVTVKASPNAAGQYGYAQIGHGGAQTTLNGLAATPTLNFNLALNAQTLRLLGGAASGAYAQVGLGGFGSTLNLRNNLTANLTLTLSGANTTALLVTAGSGAGAYAQIGHGGAYSSFNLVANTAAIQIEAPGNNAVLAVQSLSGPNESTYAQIGHGGFLAGYGVSWPLITGYDPARQTVFHSAPITINAPNATVNVRAAGGDARIGHGQRSALNTWDAASYADGSFELLFGNINLTLNARNISVTATGYHRATIGHGAGDLAYTGHLTQNSTISVHASNTFTVDGPGALIGTLVDGSEWDSFNTTLPGLAVNRRFLLSLSPNVVFLNGAYAADGYTGTYYLP